MRYSIVIILISLTTASSCNVSQRSIAATGNYEQAIQNCIIDFSKTSLFKDGEVFSVYLDSANDNLFKIDIIENESKYLYSKLKKINENKLPSRSIEYKNKLFVWWDDNYQVSQESFDRLVKYDKLQDDEGGWIKFPDFVIDEKIKAAKYYVCKKNLRKYKRIITRQGIINPPSLNCDNFGQNHDAEIFKFKKIDIKYSDRPIFGSSYTYMSIKVPK